ncbi:MAG: hydrogenase [Acidobacteria bacterium]|nr:MAG: hydrogenase [Acidobacteriota bacterium]
MFYDDIQFGTRMITLMAAGMLVTQLLIVGQRLLPTSIRLFSLQSFLLACLANTVAYFNHARHIYIAAFLTLLLKVIVMPLFLNRIVKRTSETTEVQSYLNTPVSILICGGLTLIGYMVAHPFIKPHQRGHSTLAVATALFLMGFFLMMNRRKAISQVLGLLTAENGLFLAAISLTYGMPLIVELGIFFDVLIAVMIFGILVYRISEIFDSLDTSKLRRLRG